jgi:tRNA pseudouridine13 synthase
MQFETDNITALNAILHARKLKRGVLSGNSFKMIIREWQGDREKPFSNLNRLKPVA